MERDGALELYHLVADPLEQTNLAERKPERVRELRRHLKRMEHALPEVKALAVEAAHTKDELDALKSLGYG